jgi:hypothetical protein
VSKQKLVIVGESLHEIHYNTNEELWDKIAGLTPDVRKLIVSPNSLGAAQSDPMIGGYSDSRVVQDGDTAYNTAAKVYGVFNALSAGSTVRVWEHSVLPRYMLTWGSGILGAINNQGYLYFMCLKAGTAFAVNKISLKVESYDRQRQVTVRAFNDSEAHLGDYTTAITARPSNNQAGMLALPRTTVIAGAYSRLAIDAQGIVVAANNDTFEMRMPVTVKSA